MQNILHPKWHRNITPGTDEGEVNSITLDKAVLRIDKYTETATLTATVSPADATDKTVTWKSSDETVATVDASGKITPKKAGTVTIKATAGDKTATSTVYVYNMIYNSNSYGSIEVPTGMSYLLTGNGITSNTEITICDGATVTLNGINVSKQIECKGNATIILADGSTNTVTPSTGKQAGIKVGPTGKITIEGETAGDGKLNAHGCGNAAGIGSQEDYTCGDIEIKGGDITATGGSGDGGAGIGAASGSNEKSSKCGSITISGGKVTANGGKGSAGIGIGAAYTNATSECGNITIGTGITSVNATKETSGDHKAQDPIGRGASGNGTLTCGTITFGTESVFNGSAWSSSPMAAGTYGGLTLAISGDTWTLTPAE